MFDTRTSYWGRTQRKTWCKGPYAGADNNLTLCPLQSRLQHIYHGHWALGNPMPETTLTLCQSRLQGIWIGLWAGTGFIQRLKKCERITKQQTQVHLRLNLGSVHRSYSSNIELGGLTWGLLFSMSLLCVHIEGRGLRSSWDHRTSG